MTLTQTIMTSQIITVSEGTPVVEAEDLARQKGLRYLPVIDSAGRISGFFGPHEEKAFNEAGDDAVERWMNPKVVSLGQHASLHEAALAFLEHQVPCMVVTGENHQVVGLLRSEDLLRYFVHILEEEEREAPVLDATRMLRIGEIAQQFSDAGI